MASFFARWTAFLPAALVAASVGAGCGGDDTDGPSSFKEGPGTSAGSSSGTSSGTTLGSSAGTAGTTAGSSDGGTGSTTGGTNGPLNICATQTARADLVPLDVGLAVDTSYSMDFQDKWSNVREALRAFISNQAYAGLGVGLQFFPSRAACSVSDYATPAVPMAQLPVAQPTLRTAIDAQRVSGGTPLVQVIQGMGEYMRAWAGAHPERKPILIVASDGIPDDSCTSTDQTPPNSLANAVLQAQATYKGTPSVPVFVIGVGNELTALNAVAQAGGTESAIIIDTGKSIVNQFLDALDAIRKKALFCSFPVPQSGVDTEKVNVQFSEPNKTPEVFVRTGDEAGCAGAKTNGWHYDDKLRPQNVVLCKETCERVTSSQGRLDVIFGCATRVN